MVLRVALVMGAAYVGNPMHQLTLMVLDLNFYTKLEY